MSAPTTPRGLSILIAGCSPVESAILRVTLTKVGHLVETREAEPGGRCSSLPGRFDVVLHHVGAEPGGDMARPRGDVPPELARVLLVDEAELDWAWRALERGEADHVIALPARPREVLVGVRVAVERRRLSLENQRLRRRLDELESTRTSGPSYHWSAEPSPLRLAAARRS